MQWLTDQGLFRPGQVLSGLLQPSGANAERVAHFLGRKQASHLFAKTNASVLVAPEAREHEVVSQMLRPALKGGEEMFRLGYLPSGDLKAQCEALCRYGVDRSVLLKVARRT